MKKKASTTMISTTIEQSHKCEHKSYYVKDLIGTFCPFLASPQYTRTNNTTIIFSIVLDIIDYIYLRMVRYLASLLRCNNTLTSLTCSPCFRPLLSLLCSFSVPSSMMCLFFVPFSSLP